MPIFYGIYPGNRSLRAFLTLLRFIVEPSAIRVAHVTLRGPYPSRIPRHTLRHLQEGQSRVVTLDGPTNLFQTSNQNTVGIKVNLGPLRTLWHKPDYPDGVAHITMYDGLDRTEGRWVFDTLCKYHWHFPIDVTELRELEPKVFLDNRLLADMNDIYAVYEKLGWFGLPPLNDVASMPFAARIRVFDLLLQYAQLEEVGVSFLLSA